MIIFTLKPYWSLLDHFLPSALNRGCDYSESYRTEFGMVCGLLVTPILHYTRLPPQSNVSTLVAQWMIRAASYVQH